MPDRFLRGGIEEQPATYTPDSEASPEQAESTGSTADDQTKSEPIYFFKRKPLITETDALYQQSHMLTDFQNDKVNRANFYLEMFMTLNVFLCSFLVLTLEKDFWVDSAQTKHEQMQEFTDWVNRRKDIGRQHSLGWFSTLRLMLIGVSISFFMVMMFVEIVVNMFAALIHVNRRVWECLIRVQNLLSSSTRELTVMPSKDLAYMSQMIISNL